MRYVLAKKDLALSAGFKEITHRSNKKRMLLNENEVRVCPSLTGTLEERASALGGELLSQSMTFLKINNKGEYKL